MIVRCAQNAQSTGCPVYVCTDSEIISDVVNSFDINSIKTPSFNTGTDRVHWAAAQVNCDHVMNLQGDEPLISSNAIAAVVDSLVHPSYDPNSIVNALVTLDPSAVFDTNNVKAVTSDRQNILYLSRRL